mgnify:CR=1 FL=1
MKNKIAILVARILWWAMTGKWVEVAGFRVDEVDPLLRPEDAMIARVSRELLAHDVIFRDEVLNGIARRVFTEPKHIHRNPRKAA